MQPLEEVLEQGELSSRDAVRIVTEVGAALRSMHLEGQFHLRVCPRAIVLDRHLGAHLMAAAHVGEAPIAYRSPEVLDGEAADWRADVWSLGVLCFRMLTGEEPFQGIDEDGLRVAVRHQRLPESVRELPSEVRAFLSRSLARSPQDRHAALGDVARDLAALLGAIARPEPSAPAMAASTSEESDVPGLVLRVREARARASESEPLALWRILALPTVVLVVIGLLLYWWIAR